MSAQVSVPLIVLSATAEPVEAVNGILRRAGQPAHCTWIPALPDLADALEQINPELLVCIDANLEQAVQAARVRDQVAPDVPLIALTEAANETAIADTMRRGARDVVPLSSTARLEAVMLRELRAFRLERALNATLQSARDYRRQLETVLERSNDAIAQVKEGILVEVNESWVEMFDLESRDVLVGEPLMDLFDPESHTALKGALAACLSGKWTDQVLNASGRKADGSVLPLEIVLSVGESDGEPCVRLIVPARRHDENQLAHDLADAVRRDPATGYLHRRALLEAMRERAATPATGGVRHVAQIRLDKFAVIERDFGIDGSEQILVEFAALLQGHVMPKDVSGRFGGVSFLIMIERGNTRDAESWAEQVVQHVQKHTFSIGAKTLSATCSIGLAVIPHGNPDLNAAIDDAIDACRRARQRGGNQVALLDRADADTRVQAYDQVWVKHIKAALMENRFRLVQQPIASLHGDDPQMYDLLVRMVDLQGKEVLPSEFMPAAERNDLLKNIDRWVIGASLSFVAQRKPGCVFVRLSRDSVLDPSMPMWLDGQLKATKAQPARICIQVPEDVAASYQVQVQALARALKQRGLRFALERFGAGRDPLGLLNLVSLDFIKIDGALLQGLTGNHDVQQKVRTLVDAANAKQVLTVAERVEEANTMAVLFQIGVQFVQGYFINEPEQVVLG
ncbi:MAG: GGDEF domain-containing protein [Steroidobacteraceae bacterium]|nr:GGDEF domain-containing protein [Nevskiaceae bacterium]MCP5466390.1 GGDEF domain-containing protein [Nevskiaceae bacterium]MCP5471909.1 GGDEF domain-containing protein [Nevskiaceae bacterium]